MTTFTPYYATGVSILHRMDPRSKLVAATAVSVIAFRTPVSGLAVLTALLALTPLWCRLSPGHIYRAFRPAMVFVLLLFFIQMLFPGDRSAAIFVFGPIRVTPQGCTLALMVSWRLVLLLFAGALLTVTTQASEMTRGLEKLLRPIDVVGVSSQDLALMVSLALRFIPTIYLEIAMLREARAARGGRLDDGSAIERLRALAGLVIPLCIAVFRRCDDLVVAMEARGYDGGKRSGLWEMHLVGRDWAVIGASAAAVAISFVVS